MATTLEPAQDDIDAETLLVDPESGERYVVAEQVGYLMRKAYQRHVAIYQGISNDAQLTSVQLAVLCFLAENGPDSPTVIGRLAAIDPATMRGVVSRLEARGLIAVRPDASDGRKLILSLTSAGGNMIRTMMPSAFEITAKTLQPLNPAEVVALTFLLKKLANQE